MRIKLTEEEKKARKSARDAKYYAKNQSIIKARAGKYYSENRGSVLEKQKEYNLKNCEKYRLRALNYARANPQKNRNKARDYYYMNKDVVSQKNKERYIKNIDLNAARQRDYYLKNADSIKIATREYSKLNRPKINERLKKKFDADIDFKIKQLLRLRCLRAIKSQKTSKVTKSILLLGCSIAHARQHLESQFLPGMTWGNHGPNGWHIDHIKPCASFDLTDPEQQKACSHYTNLQPLWATDNLSKGKKLDWQPQRQSAQL